MLIVLVLLAAAAFFFAMMVRYKRMGDNAPEWEGWTAVGFNRFCGATCLIVLLTIWFFAYNNSLVDNSEMTSLQHNVMSLRCTALSMNGIACVTPTKGTLADLANLKQSTNTSEMLALYTAKVCRLNELISQRKVQKKSLLWSWLVADLPEDVDYMEAW